MGLVIVARMQPIVEHLKAPSTRNPVRHLLATVSQGRYLRTFLATMMLSMGGFMLMPFGSAFTVNNLGIPLAKLPWLYMVTGAVTLVGGPLIGKLSDSIGKYKVFVHRLGDGRGVVGDLLQFGSTPLAMVIVINSVLFVGHHLPDDLGQRADLGGAGSAGPWRLHVRQRVAAAVLGRARLVGWPA